MMSFVREKCEYCHKSIYLGQSISECNLCNAVIHTNCFKKSNFQFQNGNCYCTNCYLHKYIPRYNPYKNFVNQSSQDKSYNEELIEILTQYKHYQIFLKIVVYLNILMKLIIF